eukprot:TRINITY_DN836_c0_g1_i1.p1 TRINITY_DN836_c0_g1~~TRINITY_DN836_c0_g1_i1.p1  ORF type:complete len:384 (+),score=79.19 TRINITY_DN836_c0_g1_i1:69-1220(+)
MSSSFIPAQFDIVPGKLLGPFVLGSGINAIFRLLKSQPSTFPSVECKFSEKQPLAADIALSIPSMGIMLRFDSVTQRLKYIEVYDVGKVKLTFNQEFICGPNITPTFLHVHKLLGPSFPGENEETKQAYFLHYPGLSVLFSIPPQYQSLYSGLELPFEFPDGTTPVAHRLIIYHGSKMKEPQLAPNPDAKSISPTIQIFASQGLLLTSSGKEIDLPFGVHTQEVVGLLGSPDAIYSKDPNRTKIATGSLSADYFYNYFDLGLDILFDSDMHVARKFILHGNFTTHPSFTQYSKCNWSLFMRPSDANQQQNIATVDSVWTDVCAKLGNVGQPIVHETGFSNAAFATVHYYGHENVIFEVMRNNHIASITIFDPKGPQRDPENGC